MPNGSAIAEGGAWLGGAVNLASERVSIDAQFSLPIGCGGTCLQSAGVAFSKPSAEGSFAGAEVGLLLSGSREDVNLLDTDVLERTCREAGFDVDRVSFIDRKDFKGLGRMDGRENVGILATKRAA